MSSVATSESGQRLGPVEILLRKSTSSVNRAINSIRAAESAKAELKEDLNSLTTLFDKALQKSLALIDKLDESIYSKRIENAKKRAEMEKEAQALVEKARTNPAESEDLKLYERTVNILRDSAISLHREYFGYDETVDAKDILAQLENIISEINSSVQRLEDVDSTLTERTSTIHKQLDEMSEKLKQGKYGSNASASSKPTDKAETSKHPRIVTATTSGYTL